MFNFNHLEHSKSLKLKSSTKWMIKFDECTIKTLNPNKILKLAPLENN